MKRAQQYFNALDNSEQGEVLKRLGVQKLDDAPPQKALQIINDYLEEEYPEDFPPII